jgi:hypothetical protein
VESTPAAHIFTPLCIQNELRSFWGMCNVYRRFVPHFASLAAPLNVYLTKGKPPVLGIIPPLPPSIHYDRSYFPALCWPCLAERANSGWTRMPPQPSWDVACSRSSLSAPLSRWALIA